MPYLIQTLPSQPHDLLFLPNLFLPPTPGPSGDPGYFLIPPSSPTPKPSFVHEGRGWVWTTGDGVGEEEERGWGASELHPKVGKEGKIGLERSHLVLGLGRVSTRSWIWKEGGEGQHLVLALGSMRQGRVQAWSWEGRVNTGSSDWDGGGGGVTTQVLGLIKKGLARVSTGSWHSTEAWQSEQ